MQGNKTGIPFGVQKQPTNEAKRAGLAKRKQRLGIRDLIKEVLASPYKFKNDSVLKTQLEVAFGKMDKRSIQELMILQQLQKAILEGDTTAFNSIINQGYGLPKQDLDVTSAGKAITPPSWFDGSKL